LNLNISPSRQDVKNLVGYFGAIYVGNMHANFQASSSTGMGVKRGPDGWIYESRHFPANAKQNSNSSTTLLGRDKNHLSEKVIIEIF